MQTGSSPHSPARRGFTLMEMAVVLAILGVLLRMATPSFQRAILRSREAVLRQDLAALREAIDGFHADHRRYPESLQHLVEKRYLRQLPVDPFTRRADSWLTVAAEDEAGGIFDVHSGTDLVGLDGTPYNTW
ncbi:MAG: prepilin-type N-terminal cleavage/methylation domain-containing protein [Candidatus Wallbacteria bacterium]|nr:prepilin-type N-terminal cleavage/methylation domain-containing protein [Candidatus Wallbacteria bacterium]